MTSRSSGPARDTPPEALAGPGHAPRAGPRPAAPGWLWPAATLAACTLALGALLALLALDRDFLRAALRVAAAVVGAGLAGAVALALLWLLNRARRAAIVQLQHGQPVHVADVRALTRAAALTTLERHYAVELARAERSALPALTHYAVRQEGGAPPSPPLPILEAEPMPTPVTPPAEPPDLPALVARGHVTGSALLAGLRGDTPLHIDPRACGFVAVGGQSRSGKSHTVALLVAQAVLHGWHVALCDPFPHKPDGLLSLCRPLSGAVFKQAGTPDEIIRTIQLVDKIGQRRLNGEPWDRRLLLVIEEFSNLVIRQLLPDDVLDLLPAMAMAYSAVGVHAIIIGHEFSRALLGERYGATLRRACTHRIAHRLAPDAAELLLPSAAYARQVVELQPGRALLWGEDRPQLIAVPKVAPTDLEFAAGGRPPRPYVPWPAAPPTVAAPPPAPAPATLDERIVALLASTGQQLDGNAIAAQLGADLRQVRNALTRLNQEQKIARHGQPRSYTYAAPAP